MRANITFHGDEYSTTVSRRQHAFASGRQTCSQPTPVHHISGEAAAIVALYTSKSRVSHIGHHLDVYKYNHFACIYKVSL